uniref:Glycosyl hydrolase family 57 n=1 Tax=Candidatus Kentrum sp. LFY TaxID=2126342 RepID=A0A450UFV9_9GAMM|nr:MAG: Glycosyl hydrolase family 57 [Candidatus Kentron sp. LFY]
MATMHIAFLLNFAQPADQNVDVTKRIARECYIPLSELFACDLVPRFSLSIPNVLLSHLNDTGQDGVIIPLLKKAMSEEKLEIVHSGAYSPIFPLLPEREVERQIELDFEYKRRELALESRAGIYSPELCYEDSLLSLYERLGFRWTLIDDKLMQSVDVPIPQKEIYRVDGFSIFLRSSFWSDRIGAVGQREGWRGRDFIAHLDEEMVGESDDCYRVFCLAGETFGHHIPYYHQTFLLDMLYALRDSKHVRLCRVSDLLTTDSLAQIPKREEIDKGFVYFPPSSAATQWENYERGDPYPLWRSRKNPIHEAQWQLTGLVLEATRGVNFGHGENAELRRLLDRAFYSQQYYWASIMNWQKGMKFIIHEGIDYQMRVLYKAVRMTDNQELFARGTVLYTRLMRELYRKDTNLDNLPS